MTITRRSFIGSTTGVAAALLAACGQQASSSASSQAGTPATQVAASSLKLNNAAWQYNESDNVYYQLGISYCENPADSSYETLALFVPGAYFSATSNGDGTYTCTPTSATVGVVHAVHSAHRHTREHPRLLGAVAPVGVPVVYQLHGRGLCVCARGLPRTRPRRPRRRG